MKNLLLSTLLLLVLIFPVLAKEDSLEPNNSREKASVVKAGITIKGTIFPKGDHDWYKLEVPKGKRGRLVVSLEDVSFDYCPYVSIFDSTGKEIGKHTRPEGTPLLTSVHVISQGMFWVMLRDGNKGKGEHGYNSDFDNRFSPEPYNLSLEFREVVDENEVNDELNKATSVILGKDIYGTIYPHGDKDYYKVSMPKGKRGWLSIEVKDLDRTINPHLEIYDEKGGNRRQFYRADGEELNWKMAVAGETFNVLFRDGCHGRGEHGYNSQFDNCLSPRPYTIRFVFTEQKDDFEPNDDFANATAIGLEKNIRGLIYPRRDKDYYKFSIPKGARGTIKLSFTGATSLSPHLELYSPEQKHVKTEQGKNGHSCHLFHDIVEGGTFYAIVRDGNRGFFEQGYGSQMDNQMGPYELSASLRPVPALEEINDTLETARKLEEKKEARGTLFPNGDRDFYAIDIPKGRHQVIMELAEVPLVICPLMRVYKGKEKVFERQGDKRYPEAIGKLILEGPQKYFVEICDGNMGWGEVGYGSQITNVSSKQEYIFSWYMVDEPDKGEEQDDSGRAITIPTETEGAIFPVGDVDKFSFQLSEEKELQFAIHGYSAAISPEIELLDSKKEVLARAQMRNGQPVVLKRKLVAGNYQLQIRDGFGQGEAGYSSDKDNCQSLLPYRLVIAEAKEELSLSEPLKPIDDHTTIDEALPIKWQQRKTTEIVLSGKDKETWFELGKCGPGELRIKVRRFDALPTYQELELWAKDDGTLVSLGKFSNTQGRGRGIDEAFAVRMAKEKECYLTIKQMRNWSPDNLALTVELKKNTKDEAKERVIKTGQTFLGKIWPEKDSDIFTIDLASSGRLSVSLDHPYGLPLKSRLWKKSSEHHRVLHLVGGRQDYDMFAHRPPQTDITKWLENSPEYLANFAALEKPIETTISVQGNHANLVLTGHNIEGRLQVTIAGKKAEHRLIKQWFGWSELAYLIPNEGELKVEIKANGKDQRLVSAKLLTSKGESAVAPFDSSPLPARLFKEHDIVVVEGLTSPGEFFLDNHFVRKQINDFVQSGGRFICVCPQYFSYSAIGKKGGGKVVSCSAGQPPEGLIEGRYQPWSGATFSTQKLPCEVVFSTAGGLPETLSKVVFHCGNSWNSPADGDPRQIKDVTVSLSLEKDGSTFKEVGTYSLKKTDLLKEFDFKPTAARFVKLTIKSNHGGRETCLPEFEVYGSTTVDAFWGLHFQSDWLDNRINVVDEQHPIVSKVGDAKVNGWPAADNNGWFCGAEKAGFQVIYGDKFFPKERAVTLEKKIGRGALIIDAQELGYSSNRLSAFRKIHAVTDLPILEVTSLGGQQYEIFSRGEYLLQVEAAKGLPWQSLSNYEGKIDFEPSGSAIEPNNERFFPRDIVVGKFVEDTLHPCGDVDWFRFDVEEPSVLRLSLDHVSLEWDPKMRLYHQGDFDKPVAEVNGSLKGDYGYPESKLIAIENPGIYLLRVEDVASNCSTKPYRLIVEPTATDRRYENNDTLNCATKLEPGKTLTCALYPESDKDSFYVEKEAGVIDITVNDVPQDCDPSLRWTEELEFGKGQLSILYLAAGNKEDCNLHKRLPQWFPTKCVTKDDVEANRVWQTLSQYDAVILDGLSSLKDFAFGEAENQRLIEGFVREGGRFILLSPSVMKHNHLAKSNGGTVVSCTSQWDNNKWNPSHLIDELVLPDNSYGWCSGKEPQYPQEIVFAFAKEEEKTISSLLLYNTAQTQHRRIKEIEVLGSVESSKEGFNKLADFTIPCSDGPHVIRFGPRKIRYLKISIKSNYGDKGEAQFGELCAFTDDAFEKLFGVEAVELLSNSRVVATTEPQGSKYTKGPLNGFGSYDVSGWFNGWEDDGFKALCVDGSNPSRGAITLFKRMGKGILVLEAHRLGNQHNQQGMWKIYNLLDVAQPQSAQCDGTVGTRGCEERLRIDCGPGKYYLELLRGRYDLASLSPVKLRADYKAGKDITNPCIASTFPPNESSSLSPKSRIFINLSEPINDVQVNKSRISIQGSQNGSFDFATKYYKEDYRLELRPNRSFGDNEKVVVKVEAGAIKDLCGKANEETTQWSFLTGTMARSKVAITLLFADKPPFGAGRHYFSLRSTGALEKTPSVLFKREGSNAKRVSLAADKENLWRGFIEIGQNTGDGNGSLVVEGKDENGASVSVTGQLNFAIDTTPPKAPSFPPVLRPNKGGAVVLSWQDTEGTIVVRRGRTATSLTPITKVKAASKLFEDSPGGEGKYFYAISTIDDAGNESSPSKAVSIVTDITPPKVAPGEFRAVVTKAGTISLSWHAVEEDTVGYDIHRVRDSQERSAEPTIKVDSGALRTVDTPVDGSYTYYIAARDGAGNVGPYAKASVILDRAAAHAYLKLLSIEPIAPVTATKAIEGRCPPGKFTFSLQLNEEVVEGPVLRAKLADGKELPLEVAEKKAVLTLPKDSADGYVTIVGHAVDKAGNKGLSVSFPSMYLDTVAPRARIKTNRQEKPWKVTMYLSEPIVGTPKLSFTVEGTRTPVKLAATQNYGWTGILEVDESKEGEARYSFEAIDYFGRKGTIITEGATFVSDTTPPGPPTHPEVLASRGGRLQLTWKAPLDEVPAYYRVYRSDVKSFTPPPEKPYRDRVGSPSLIIDGVGEQSSFFRVTAVDRAGNEGKATSVFEARPDSTPPPRPEELVAKLDKRGTIQLSWKEPKGEPIAFYRVYRKKRLVGRRVEDKFFNERIDGQGLASYRVTAVDLAGNEGEASSVDVNFDTSPPTALLEIEPSVSTSRGIVYLHEGKLSVTLLLSEAAAETPSLQYRTSKMTDLSPLPLKPQGSNRYKGEFEIEKGEDGPLFLMLKVSDKSGNECTEFTPRANYHIDTTAPFAVRSLKVKAIEGGRVKLEWAEVEGEKEPVDYLLFRKGVSEPIAVLTDKRTYTDEPGDGKFDYSIIARDCSGLSSERMDWVSCISDSTPPPTPGDVQCKVTDKVRLTWAAQRGQRYKVYRVQEGGKSVVAADLVGLGGFEESPIADGNFTYLVVAIDDAGNESLPSRALRASFAGRVPTAKVKLIPPSPILGPVKIELTSNCQLKESPVLVFHDSQRNELPVTLTKTRDRCFVGTLQLNDKYHDGLGLFTFLATSHDGLVGSTVVEGKNVVVDREVPRGIIEYGKPSPFMPGNVKVTLRLSEKLASTPQLFVNLPGEKSKELKLGLVKPDVYEGQVEIPKETKEGRAYLLLVAKDLAGNYGGLITRGKYFDVDQTPPREPSSLDVKATKGGFVNLEWFPPIYSATERSSTVAAYRVYRSESSMNSTTEATLVRTVTYGARCQDKPPKDGEWFYGVTTVDEAGWESKPVKSSVRSKGKKPLPPVITEATTGVDYVLLKLSSEEKSQRTTPVFNIYVHQIGSRRQFAGSVPNNEYRGVPPTGGEYYFYASEVDEFGNESDMSSPAKVSFKKVAPVASISLSPKGPVGPKGAIVKLVASCRLVKNPALFFSPPGGGRLAVELEGPAEDGLTYRGELKPPRDAQGGVGYFSWRGIARVEGKDVVGVAVNEGVSCQVDCTAPTCMIEALSTIRRFNNVPVYPIGQHEVALLFSEKLRESPRLTLRLRNKGETVLNVEKVGPTKYRAFFKVDETMGECDGHFLIQAFDYAGNEGTIVTRGDSIRVDTIAPTVVNQMRVALLTEGKVRIEWTPSYRKDGTLDKAADRFEVFRTTRELNNVEGLPPFKVVDHMLGAFDRPTADGVYRYALRAVDRGGNKGGLTKWASATVDKSPPSPPVNLAVRQTKDGVVELTWDEPKGEKPLYYNAYIASEPIRTIVGLSPMNQRIPFTRVLGTPNSDGVYYFVVTAVDKALNESAISNCQHVDYRQLAPIASFKIEPDIWLKDGIYDVKLETTEDLAAPPQVVVNSESGKRFPLTFLGSGKKWQGKLNVSPSLSEGTYGFIFRGKDLQGNMGSEIASGPLFHVDRKAPLPPGELAGDVSTKVDGAITLRWRSPKRKTEVTEVPYFYRIYRSLKIEKDLEKLSPIGFVKVEFKNQDHYERTDLPPTDGRWYYAVTSLDLAKNVSEPSWAGPFDIASGKPRAVIRLFTKATGDKPASRIGKGEARLVLTSSAPLAAQPKLSYKLVEGDDQTGKEEVHLVGSGTRWEGKLEFGDYSFEQDGTFSFSGTTVDGKRGSYIAEGATFVVDTTGPVGEINIPSISKYRVNMKTNALETPPIKEGRIDVELNTHKPLAAAPQFQYVINGVKRNISMRGFANQWRGQIDTTNGHPEGDAKFIYRGVDRLGNVSEKIAPQRKWYITDERFPKPRVLESFTTIGEKFSIDTTAPFPPTNVKLEVRKLGVAVLTWDEPEGNPARYRLYRSLTPIGSIEGLKPIKERIFAKVIVDAPPCDGNWFYVVTAVDIGGNESAPSKCVNMFVDSIKPELKIKPVPEGDGFFIVLDDEEVPPELSLTLKFPGQDVKKVTLGGSSGKLKVIPNYRHSGKPAVYLPQRVEAFNGTVKVVVHSPDPEGNIVERSTTIEGKTVTPENGGTVQSLDESVTLEIPPGLEPVVPLGPNKVKRIDGYDKLFFITYANIPKEKSKIATGTVPGRNDLDPLPPGLEVVSRPYTVNINVPPSEPLSLKPKATQANLGGLKELVAKLRMKIPSVGSEVIEDPEYLKTRLKVMKWIPATKEKRGSWKRVPDEAIVLDPENKELIVPADSVTTYVIVSEQTPPTIKELEPADGTSVTEMAPTISALIVDKGTGIAMGAENRIVLRLDGDTIQLTDQNMSQGDPTEVKVTWKPSKELTPGPHIVTLEAEDVVGNRRVAKWLFNVDNKPPIIEELRVGKDGLVVLTAHDPGGSLNEKKISIEVAGRKIPHLYVKELNHIVARLSKVADGLHDIFARVVDGGGKKAEKTVEYLHDRALPTIEARVPLSDGLLLKPSGKQLLLELTSQSGIDLTSLQLFVDGKSINKSGDEGGKSGYRFDREKGHLTFDVPFEMADGKHEIHLAVSDKKGNQNKMTVPFTTMSEPTKLDCRLDLGSPKDGMVIVSVDRLDEIITAKGRQEDDPVLTTFDSVTGTVMLETKKNSTIHLFLTDKAGGELKATINPNDGSIKTLYDEGTKSNALVDEKQARLFWLMSLLMLGLISGLLVYHRKRFRS